ncbi:MAG TPA: GNAT family N-acetyltransferase [Acidimicrobiia bacterium]|nr:GNAT family N-acetyltransferase [Acidimicrobiia bacterium]
MDSDGQTSSVNEFVEHLAFTAVLNDGTPVRVRPIAPKDRDRLAEGWKNLSAQSRYLRFLQAKPTLSEKDLTYLTEIDYNNHFAWAAETLESEVPPGVGIARYIRTSDDPTVAEAAIAVVDEHQRKGLGRILLQALAEAAHANGIERFRAYVSMDNRQVLESLTAIGATRSDAGAGMVQLELPVPTSALEESPLYLALRTVAAIPHHPVQDPAA